METQVQGTKTQVARYREAELLSVQEAAELMKVGTDTLRGWMRKGLLAYMQFGPKRAMIRIDRAEVERFIEESQRPVKTNAGSL